MDFDWINKQTLTYAALAIVVLCVISWFMGPSIPNDLMEEQMAEAIGEEMEAFNAEAENEEKFQGEKALTVKSKNGIVNPPYIGPNIGTIMDGPGYIQPDYWDKAEQGSPVGSTIPSNYYFLDDGANGKFSIQHNLCSKSCCSDQWPTPFKQKYDPYVCGNKDKFVSSRIMCNNSAQDSGCLCLSKEQASFIYNRGGNGREWF